MPKDEPQDERTPGRDRDGRKEVHLERLVDRCGDGPEWEEADGSDDQRGEPRDERRPTTETSCCTATGRDGNGCNRNAACQTDADVQRPPRDPVSGVPRTADLVDIRIPEIVGIDA